MSSPWGRRGGAAAPGRRLRVACAKDEPNSTKPTKRSNPTRSSGSGTSGGFRGWWQRLPAAVKVQTPLRLLANIVIMFFLMRLWPMGGRVPPSMQTAAGETEHFVLQVPFSDFVRRVKQDEVNSVTMDGVQINFVLRPGSSGSSTLLQEAMPEGLSPSARITYATVRPADYSVPYSVLEKNSVPFSAVVRRNNGIMTVMVYMLYAGLFLSALNRLPLKLPQKGAGRKHKGQDASSPVTFEDVAGVDEAKEELAEIVEYLRAPERFSKLGARPPSGVLLVGPPGTGKTLLARAVAGEADVPFYSISASEFVELYVGMGAMRVRELFAQARKESPAIVFIDEIDAVAKGRDMRLRSVGNDEREQTLNQLLTELDGFDSDKDNVVICIAATNRPDVLDPALLRPGRFDRRVAVERPDRLGREQILRVHLEKRGLPLSDDVSVPGLAGMTTGFTGADLANLVNEAALLAGRRHASRVGHAEFDQAILRAVAGVEKKRSILRGMEKEVVARHEVGHALVSTAVARLLPGAADVEKLSIIPRSGGALGFTYIPNTSEDRALLFDSEIRGQLAMLMGGRAAEQLTCTAVSTGAVDDIRRATDLAYKSVSEYGLNTAIGPLNVGVLSAGGGDDSSWLMKDGGNTSKIVEREVKSLLDAALQVATHVITCNRSIHDALANLLTKHERLEGVQLQEWLQHVKVPVTLQDFVVRGVQPAAATLAEPFAVVPPEQLEAAAKEVLSAAGVDLATQPSGGDVGQLTGDVAVP